ncbi:MAG: sulfatase [Cyclobacteriaceae bacterium]|uniref:sulfatase n=1 Tax=Reichenbachiella sp. TaxID=2184521 RepID=UPI0032635EE9
MKKLVKRLLIIFIGITMVACRSSPDAKTERPNVLLILVDDFRPAIGAYGDSFAHTPAMDAFAKEAMLFENAYTQQAVCAPSRNTLLTGMRPDGLGIYDLGTFFRTNAPNLVTLPQIFKNNGYVTAGMGKVYHTAHGNSNDTLSWSIPHWTPDSIMAQRKPINNGDTVNLQLDAARINGNRIPWYQYPSDLVHPDILVTENALDCIEKYKDQPFFLTVGLRKPHLPFNAPKKYWDIYDGELIKIPDTSGIKDVPVYAPSSWGELRKYHKMPKSGPMPEEHTKPLIHGYYACTSMIDDQIGRLLNGLKEQKLYNNTIVIIWGDHGYKLGEYGDWCKHSNFEIDTRVPLMVRVPGLSNGGSRTESIVETVDIYPTLAEAAGIVLPDHLQGDSFLQTVSNPTIDSQNVAFSQYRRTSDGRRLMGRSMRTREWRYTRWEDRDTGELIDEELYDHRVSREEKVNLSNMEEFAEVKTQLRSYYLEAYPEAHLNSL